MRMVDLYFDLTSSAQGMAPVPFPPPPAIESFQGMADHHGALEYAGLHEVYNYLRGNKNLSIPDNWRQFLPKTLAAWTWQLREGGETFDAKNSQFIGAKKSKLIWETTKDWNFSQNLQKPNVENILPC